MANLQRQIDTMAQYLAEACQPAGNTSVILEIEHFVTRLDGTPAAYEQLADVLRAVQGTDEPLIRENAFYAGYRNRRCRVEIGAGCQMSVRLAPAAGIRQAMSEYADIYSRLCEALADNGLRTRAVGVHPTRRAEVLPLVQRERYIVMDRYFRTTGSQGSTVMRAAAATLITVPYHSESDFVRKFRAGSLIAPLLALLTDNAPYYQGTPNHSYSRHCQIWNNVDPDRCGICPGVMEPDFGFSAYAAHIMQQPLVVARHGRGMTGVGRKTALEIYPSALGEQDLDHILSMFYYDVVPVCGGLTLRIADSMPPRYIASYAQLVKTILSSRAVQEGILRRYAGANTAQIEAAKVGICCNGYQAQVYGRAVYGELYWLMAQARSHAAAPEDRRLLEPLTTLLIRRKTLRDIPGQ